MNRWFRAANLLYLLLFCLLANSFLLVKAYLPSLILIVPLFLFINVFAGALRVKSIKRRLVICHHGGVVLGVFALSLVVAVTYHAILAVYTLPDDPWTWVWSAVWCICAEAILFWNGIVCVYLTSAQLGIRLRLIGVLCGMIPIANLVVLSIIIRTVMDEVHTETEKEALNASRRSQRVCATKYPLLMVHGVFFRDFKYFNYWGRIPAELEKNGARVFYGEHSSALPVAQSGEELAARIRYLAASTGCEKFNIIAHSKGGLDCRYALSELGIAPFVASLTTVNTPHRGCLFADKLLDAAPQDMKESVAKTYNAALKKLGDRDPDFIRAVSDLTASACAKFNQGWTFPEGVFCQSIGTRLNRSTSGQFPLNLSYHLVRAYDGKNDGLVGEDSFAFGEDYRLLTTDGKRGISHADIIDLNRENLPGFDVREFYVELVSELKARGL